MIRARSSAAGVKTRSGKRAKTSPISHGSMDQAIALVQSTNQPISQSIDQSINQPVSSPNPSCDVKLDQPIFRYPFMVHLVLPYLLDDDVLLLVAPLAKAMRQLLSGYTVKRCITSKDIEKCGQLFNSDRHLPLTFSKLSIRMSALNDPKILSMPSLTYIELDFSRGDRILSVGMLSQSLEELRLGKEFNRPLARGLLPHKLQTLRLGSRFNKPILPNMLPDTLKELSFDKYFDQPLEVCSLPASLTALRFTPGSSFKHPLLPGVLPPSLITLALPVRFQHPLNPGVLPPNLEGFSLPGDYPHSFDVGSFPGKLERMHFGSCLSRPILPGVLPSSLRKLSFGYYQHPLPPGVLPAGLQKLDISRGFTNELVVGSLPDTLEDLTIDCQQPSLGAGVLPASLRTVCLSPLNNLRLEIGSIPLGVNKLKIRGAYIVLTIVPGAISLSVEHLAIDRSVLSDIQLLLPIEISVDLEIGSIPISVKHLEIPVPEPGMIPGSVTNLRLMACGDDTDGLSVSSGVIPPSVTHLTFGGGLQAAPVKGTIPPSVTHLTFERKFCQRIDPAHLPDGLLNLRLPSKYRSRVNCRPGVHVEKNQ